MLDPRHRISPILLLLALGVPGLAGQATDSCGGDVRSAACRASGPLPALGGPHAGGDDPPRSSTATLASLALPGSGQLVQGRDRGWAYLGVEAMAVLGYLERSRSGDRLRSRYRDLAWEVARIQTELRRDGDFGYYEALGEYASSGAWDRDPATEGLQPETNPETYNGRIWKLAREIYLGADDGEPGSEAYERALDYYRERGYGPGMRWSWPDDPEARQRYRGLIDRSDERFREATIALGIVLGNHILSAVDAFASSRLGAHPGSHSLSLGPVRRAGPTPTWGLRVDFYR